MVDRIKALDHIAQLFRFLEGTQQERSNSWNLSELITSNMSRTEINSSKSRLQDRILSNWPPQL